MGLIKNSNDYVDEGKHSKIVLNKHFIEKIKYYHPLSIDYIPYWKSIKRRCMEGMWAEGKWMPGNLFMYINLCRIRLNKDRFSTTKIIGKPLLRDLEWEKAYVFAEARGFSGFQDDPDETCYLEASYVKATPEEIAMYIALAPPQALKDGKFKKYVPPREYLRRIHTTNLGKPLYQNNAWNVIDMEARGSGKDLEENTLVYGENGPFPIRDIKVGDLIYGRDGKLTKVIERKDFSDQLQHRVSLSDGRSILCGEGHLWTVSKSTKKGLINTTLTLKDIKESYYTNRSTGVKDFKYGVPICDPIEFSRETFDINPYYLGLWLGDGNSHNTGITTMDQEIADFLSEYREELGMSTLNKQTKPYGKASTYTITNGGKGGDGSMSNPLKNKLRDLGVLNNKHIPDSILYTSVEYRLEILRGLMDSDGYVHDKKAAYEISTSYDGLKNTIPKLLGGLGIRYKTKIKDKALVIRFLTDLDVVKLKRKANAVVKTKSKYGMYNKSYSKIVNIEPVGVRKSVCIKVDNDDSLFIAGDYIVTHNSYWGANGMILNTWLTDGLYDYDVYEEQMAAGELASVEVLVGAIEGKFTKDLLDKVLVSMDDFVGNQIINGTLHPSPIMKRSSGSWYSGKQYIENKFEVKVGGSWQTRGSGSKIYNRAFMDNPFAGNGTRPSVTVIEEVGFFNILDEALGALKDVTYNSADKFGTIYMFGTGGENDAMAVAKVKEVFTDPSSYDCLSFDDTWENTGSIGFFIPFELTLNNFKDEEGITDMQQATSFADGKRLKLSKGKSKTPLYSEMMNNPRVPSEIFLAKDANIFPTAELKDHLNYLKAHQTDPVIKGQNGMFGIKMINADTARVEWEPDLTNSLTPCHYPMKKTDATEGCWVIWEHPVYVDGEIPHGLYIAGNDPYDQDKAPNSVSLGSTFIYKTMMIGDSDQLTNFIVAEYTARPATAKEHHEQVRRGLLYYNARCLYENERNTLQMHFDHKNSLYLLTKTPTILKATATSNVQRSAGTHMTESIKDEIEIYTRDELLESIGDERLALHKINSIPLIEELIAYNRRGNFDRVIAFMLVVLNKLNNHKLKVESISTSKTTDPFFDRFNKGMFYK